MVETLLGILASVLMVAGAVSIIKWAALKVAASDCNGKRAFVILLDGKDADIKLQMMIQTLEWENALYGVKAVALNGGLEPEMDEYCRMLCKNARITYLGAEESQNLIKTMFQ